MNSLKTAQASVLALVSLGCNLQASETAVVQEKEHSISMLWKGSVLWTYNHAPAEGKPYFHPLANTKGNIFTDLRPKDHPWHRGVWHSWKYINGVNYWEEDRKTGLSDGRTSITSIKRSVSPDNTVTLSLKLSYAPAANPAPVMTESRTVTVSPPNATGSYNIEWVSEFTALDQKLTFERTPPTKKKPWAGYAGLSIRMSKELKAGTFISSEGLKDAAGHAKTARWVSHTSPISSTIIFMDHPKNYGFPSKWYIGLGTNYFSPAVIYDAPYQLEPHKKLSYTYKIHVSADELPVEKIEALWKKWTQAR